jgi:hypothetical protein
VTLYINALANSSGVVIAMLSVSCVAKTSDAIIYQEHSISIPQKIMEANIWAYTYSHKDKSNKTHRSIESL